jgi:hypothetical protein
MTTDSADPSPVGEPPAGTGPEGVPDPPTGPVRILGVGRPDRPRTGWPEIVVAAVVYVVIQVALGLAVVLASGGRDPSAPWLVAVSAVSAFGAVGAAVSLRVRSLAAVGVRRVRVRTVLLAVGIGLATWCVSRLLILAYVGITGDHSDPQAALAEFGGPDSTALVVVIGGLVVPVGEEMLFRGVAYGGLRRYGAVLAAIVSALVFGLAHGLNVVFAAAVLLGLVNATLYERTRSIWPCVAAHATFNLLSFTLALVLR